MKKYLFGVKNILLLLASFLPLLCALFVVFVLAPIDNSLLESNAAYEAVWVEIILYNMMAILIPFVYIGVLALILIFSNDFWHWLALDMIVMITMLLFLCFESNEQFAPFVSGHVENRVILDVILLVFTLSIHGGIAAIKLVMESVKKRRQVPQYI